MVLRCVGIFVSATMSALVIMVPKYLVIQVPFFPLSLFASAPGPTYGHPS